MVSTELRLLLTYLLVGAAVVALATIALVVIVGGMDASQVPHFFAGGGDWGG